MRYSYSYKNNTLYILKLLLLAVAMLADLVNLFMLVSAIFQPMILLYIFSIFALFLIIRISTVYMTYTIEISYFAGILNVKKMYFRKLYPVLEFNKKDIVTIKRYDQNIDNDDLIRIYVKTCDYTAYVVELSDGRKVLLKLDDTLYAALTCEDEYDLFR